MNKMQVAHQMALAMAANGDVPNENIVAIVWEYADAMQAEADERNKEEAEQKRKEVREILNDVNTFIEREGQHFDDVADIQKPYTSSEEWQPGMYPEYEHGRDYPSDAWVTFNGEARLAVSIKEDSLRERPQ